MSRFARLRRDARFFFFRCSPYAQQQSRIKTSNNSRWFGRLISMGRVEAGDLRPDRPAE
jgi:hypothetical protein